MVGKALSSTAFPQNDKKVEFVTTVYGSRETVPLSHVGPSLPFPIPSAPSPPPAFKSPPYTIYVNIHIISPRQSLLTGYGRDDSDSSDDDDGQNVKSSKPKSVTWADPIDDAGEAGPAPSGKGASESGVEGVGASAAAKTAKGVGLGSGVLLSKEASGREGEDEANQGFQIGAVHLLKKQVRKVVACVRVHV